MEAFCTTTPSSSLACPPCSEGPYAIKAPAWQLRSSFEKSPFGCHLLLLTSAWLSTHSNFNQSRVYLSHGQSQSLSSLSSRCHPIPQFLWYCPSRQQQPQPGCATGFVSLTAFLSPETLSTLIFTRSLLKERPCEDLRLPHCRRGWSC